MDTEQSDRIVTFHRSDFAGSYPIPRDTARVEVAFKQRSLTACTWCFTYLKVAEVTVICFHKLSFIHVLQEIKSEASPCTPSTTRCRDCHGRAAGPPPARTCAF